MEDTQHPAQPAGMVLGATSTYRLEMRHRKQTKPGPYVVWHGDDLTELRRIRERNRQQFGRFQFRLYGPDGELPIRARKRQ